MTDESKTKRSTNFWMWRVNTDVLENLLFRYTADRRLKKQKKLIMEALTAFYLPLACESADCVDEAEVLDIYRRSRAMLLQQVETLDAKFGGDNREQKSSTHARPSISASTSESSEPVAGITPAVKSPVAIDFNSLY
ncbi:hypothetical protein [Chamaesiphon sp. OTE_20_metabat_361]|uniref:hypothetical protein n=1 Tax=Chamaesiphon sp. OTE_20_metabat_361 TaxID=2964689 RepID=UPI00286AA151|nr:hypothetical protein [Chamaesiphon sp. OTE_20_metabat_361]